MLQALVKLFYAHFSCTFVHQFIKENTKKRCKIPNHDINRHEIEIMNFYNIDILYQCYEHWHHVPALYSISTFLVTTLWPYFHALYFLLCNYVYNWRKTGLQMFITLTSCVTVINIDIMCQHYIVFLHS